MAEEKVVDWSVPITSELVPGDTIPPVCIKSLNSIVKTKSIVELGGNLRDPRSR